jgi:cytochrome P450
MADIGVADAGIWDTGAGDAGVAERTAVPLAELVRLVDPAFYRDPHPVYDRLRTEDPVHYYAPLDLFVLTRYSDLRAAAKRPDVFSSAHGVVLSQLMDERAPARQSLLSRFIDPAGEIFSFTDPPRHRQLRRVLMPAFAPRAVAAMTGSLQESARLLVAGLPAGVEIDFVAEVAAQLPLLTATTLLGVPESYADDIRRWSDARELLTAGAASDEQLAAAADTFGELNGFLREQFARRRAAPAEDLLTVLLAEQLDGEPLSEARLLTYCHQILSVGSDTSRALLSGFAIALARFPEQQRALAGDRRLMATALEEALRWTSPGRGFVRTATVDAEIDGHPVRAGQRIYLLYAAGNFDPTAFEDPHRFDVTRVQEVQHLAFGSGPHVCIAAQLVRAEAAALFDALLNRFPGYRLAAEPTPVEHVLRNGWAAAPMLLPTR